MAGNTAVVIHDETSITDTISTCVAKRIIIIIDELIRLDMTVAVDWASNTKCQSSTISVALESVSLCKAHGRTRKLYKINVVWPRNCLKTVSGSSVKDKYNYKVKHAG